jgi:hypothetical protein
VGGCVDGWLETCSLARRLPPIQPGRLARRLAPHPPLHHASSINPGERCACDAPSAGGARKEREKAVVWDQSPGVDVTVSFASTGRPDHGSAHACRVRHCRPKLANAASAAHCRSTHTAARPLPTLPHHAKIAQAARISTARGRRRTLRRWRGRAAGKSGRRGRIC